MLNNIAEYKETYAKDYKDQYQIFHNALTTTIGLNLFEKPRVSV